MIEVKKELKYVGKPIPVYDAKAKVTGKIKYTGDMKFNEMLYAKLIFSPLPHAKIVDIDTTEAYKIPGVIKIYTHENTPKTRYNSKVWFTGMNEIEDEQLFPDIVRFVGDRVAAVVASDKETAERAAELIHVKYEELPFVIDPKQAMNNNIKVHPMDNPFFTTEMKCGDVDKVFKDDCIVVEDEVETQKVHHGAMENHVCIAIPEHNGKITIFSPCQLIYSVRLIVAKILGLPFNKIKIIEPPMGGSFGGKQEVILEPLAAFFAMDTGKPVKIEFNRRENIISTRTRHKTIGYVKTAVNREGKILARDVSVIVDTGAYTSNGPSVSSAMGKKLFRLYRIENQRYRPYVVHTNTPIAGAVRGFGSTQIHAITEINIDHVARKLSMDPVEFRLKNLVHPYDRDPLGNEMGNARIIDCVLKGMEEFDWKNKWNRPKGTGRYRKGVGMACASHVNGYYGVYQDFMTMTLKMLEDGSLILNAALHDLGQGTITIIKQIIAEIMDIDPSLIEIPQGDTDSSPFDVGCIASRGTFVCGACAMKVAESLRNQFMNESAKIFKCKTEQVIMENGMVWSANVPDSKMSYGEMVNLIQRKNQVEIICTLTYDSRSNPASMGANFAEVEVDTLTGLVKVLNIVAVFDVGKAINKSLVEGQINGGIQMGLGFALSEDINIDPKTGNVRGDRFSRYHVFNAPAMPDIRIFLIEEGEDYGPFGAKSIGEIATIPTAPAVVNAINNALGTNFTKLPLTPERILQGLKH